MLARLACCLIDRGVQCGVSANRQAAFWKLVIEGVRAAEDGTSAHRQKRKRRGGTDTIQAAIDSIEGVSVRPARFRSPPLRGLAAGWGCWAEQLTLSHVVRASPTAGRRRVELRSDGRTQGPPASVPPRHRQ